MNQILFTLVFVALSWTTTWAADDKELAQKYARVFEDRSKPLKPDETLDWLKRLDELLDEELLAEKENKKWVGRKERIQKLIGHSANIGQDCDLEAMHELSESLNYHTFYENGASIRKYLASLKDKAFELCRADITEIVNDAELRLNDGSSSNGRVLRLKQLFVEQFPDPTSGSYPSKKLYPLLLAFMDEQEGARLSAESLSKQEFKQQFEQIVTDTCRTILDEFRFYSKLYEIVTSTTVKQLDRSVVDWFIARKVCLTISVEGQAPRAKGTVGGDVYELLVARSS